MRLKYKILWFENDDGTFTSFSFDEIRAHLGDRGFEGDILHMKGEEPPDEIITQAQKSDLIVMDFALEGPEQGDELIDRIRSLDINTEVVFYSAAGVSTLRDRVREKELDGVYCRGRADITTDVIPIIDSTIRKVLDLENSRGLVMAELGELDLLMNDIIISVHEATDEKKAFIRKKMKEKLDSQVKGFAQKLEGFDSLPIHEIVETFLDSAKRLTSMVSISKNLGVNGYRDRLNGYKETVFFPRNCLAHGIAEEIAEGGYVFRHDGKEFTFNDASNVELRKSLRDFSSCLHDLQAEILAALPKTQPASDES
jgi:CheY-like chemotaxis protein